MYSTRLTARTTTQQVLAVTGDRSQRPILADLLPSPAFDLRIADTVDAAWEFLIEQTFDAVLIDVQTSAVSLEQLIKQFRQVLCDVPMIAMIPQIDAALASQALSVGAQEFITKPLDRIEFLFRLNRCLQEHQRQQRIRQRIRTLEEQLANKEQTIREAHEETIHRLVEASIYRDDETGAHIKRTGWYSELVASAAGWSRDQIDLIRLAAPMHDVGKIGIPDSILRKPGKLTPEEFDVMKTHTTIGANMLRGSKWAVLSMGAEIALAHHEYWNGMGYPHGIAGEQIPISARVLSIVDVYDALSHDRVYRPAFSEERVIEMMQQGRGTQFDPELFDLFMTLLPEMRVIAQTISDETPLPLPPIHAEPLRISSHVATAI